MPRIKIELTEAEQEALRDLRETETAVRDVLARVDRLGRALGRLFPRNAASRRKEPTRGPQK